MNPTNRRLDLTKLNLTLVLLALALLIPTPVHSVSEPIKVGITAPSQVKPGDTLKIWISATNFGEALAQAQSQNISEQIKILSTLSEKNKVTTNEIEVGNPFLTIAEDKKITALNEELISAGDALRLKKQRQEELYKRLLKENLTLEEIKPYVEQEKLLNEIIEKGSTGAFVELQVPKEYPEGKITIPIKVSYSSRGITNYVTTQATVTITSDPQPEKAVIFIVDAARADKMYDSASAGLAPNIKSLIDDGVKFTSAKTVFPSITPSGHSAILTGAYPARSGIPGMTWFNKNNFEYKDYNALYYKIKWEVNNDLLVETLFEGIEKYAPEKNTATIFEFVRNGADDQQGLSAAMAWDYLRIEEKKARNDSEGIREWSKELDSDTLSEALYRFRAPQLYYSNENPPDVTAIWLVGNDIISHEGGPDETYGTKSMSNVDAQVGRLLNEPAFQPIRGETVFVITADHGQTSVTKDDVHAITQDELEEDVLKDVAGYDVPDFPGEQDYDAIAAPNGGMAQIYIRDMNTKNWNDQPELSDLRSALDAFYSYSQSYVDTVLVKYSDSNGYMVYTGRGNTQDLETSFSGKPSYIDAVNRVRGLDSSRSGDIILLANYSSGYYFENDNEVGTHGGLNDKDTYVPLIFAGPGVKHDTLSSARTIDVAPTIAKLLGFEDKMVNIDGRVLEEIIKTPPQSKTLTVSNTGNANLQVTDITTSKAWLSASPKSFTISSGGSNVVTVTVDPSNEPYGAHTGKLFIKSNDPDESTKEVKA